MLDHILSINDHSVTGSGFQEKLHPAFGLAAALNRTDSIRQFEWKTLDWRTGYRVAFQPPPDPRLWMVLFDDNTEEAMVAWPDSRPWHGQLAQLLSAHGAKVLTYDVFITSERDPDADKAMADAMADARKRGLEVVTGALRSDSPTESSETTQYGPTEDLKNVTGDLTGVVQAKHAALPIPVLRAASSGNRSSSVMGVRSAAARVLLPLRRAAEPARQPGQGA